MSSATSAASSAQGGSQNPEALLVAHALAATRAAGLKPYVAYVPRPSASSAQIAAAAQSGSATPLYTGDPAPMGVADYGLGLGGEVFVANTGSDTVIVINGTTNSVVATVVVGADPYAMALDPVNRDVYVANEGSTTVSVISGTTNSLVATITVGSNPYAVTYDTEDGEIYVANFGSNTVSVIDGTSVLYTLHVGSGPAGVAYDSSNSQIFVSNFGSGTVSVIGNNSVFATITVGVTDEPFGITYNSGNDTVDVADYNGSSVSIISPMTDLVAATVGVGIGPGGLAYDAGLGYVYVTNLLSNTVTVLSGTTVVRTITGFDAPWGVAYEVANGDMYVANEDSGTVSVLSGTSVVGSINVGGVGAYPAGVAYGAPLIASTLETTALQGYVDANATGIQGEDLYQSSPDAFSIQMNAVLSNITINETSGYTFWAQDVVTYLPASGQMFLVTNIWNFSGEDVPVSSNAIYSHGPYGTNIANQLSFYYANYTVNKAELYPFDVELTMNSSLWHGRNNVSFSASISSTVHPTEDDFVMNNYDWVVFNSTNSEMPVAVPTPAPFVASGTGYNAAGLLDDYELDICGPGGASQVDLATADANLGLAYDTAPYPESPVYASIPSAYSYGSDTGETSVGANVAWSDNPSDSPGGLATYGTMTTGPSILTGLWGTGAPEGSSALTIAASEQNAFTFFNYTGTQSFATPLVSQWDLAPNMGTDTFYLMPGNYALHTELSAYSPTYSYVSCPCGGTVNIYLTSDPSLGVYTPLWAFNNAELADLAVSGAGSSSDPYLLEFDQPAPLSSDFGLYNDYSFPVYPGVFLRGTTDYVELNNSSTFETYTNDFQPYGLSLPATNHLQFWFWDVNHVALHNDSNVSGWFGRNGYLPLTYNSFNVVFYESEDNLVANNVFMTQSQGLLMYSNSSAFGPPNTVGGNNTVWGNRFIQISPPVGCPGPSACFSLLSYAVGLGLELGEGYDLVYNNLFATPTTAWLLPVNLYTGAPFLWSDDVWNISAIPASTAEYAPGFPSIPLVGNIVGGSTQGGNSWWDYGVALNWANGADNPLLTLPYDENAQTVIDPSMGYGSPLPGYLCSLSVPTAGPYYCATYIYSGGDYSPLATDDEAVSVEPQGITPGTEWSFSLFCNPAHGSPGGPPGCGACAPAHGTPGGPPGCSTCTPAHGSPGSPPQCDGPDPPNVLLDQVETTASVVHLVLPVGEYSWVPYVVPTGYTSSSGGTFNATGPVNLVIPYVPVASPLAVVVFSEGGLPAGLTWEVTLRSGSTTTTLTLLTDGGTDSLVFTGLAGTYQYTIASIPGWQQTTLPYTGSVTGGAVTEATLAYTSAVYAVTFAESGLPTSDQWYVNLTDGQTLSGTGGVSSLSIDLANGTYSFTVATNDKRYQPTATPPSPCVVNGLPVSETVTFTLVNYAVTFTESGLPATATWYVNITSGPSLHATGATTSLVANLANGTYAFTVATNDKLYEPSSYPPSPCIVNGKPVTESGSFVLVTYPVAFTESGLPGGTSWSVTLGSTTITSTGSTITFQEPNGTYSYTVGSVSGYVASPSGGSLSISGAGVTQAISYGALTLVVSPGQGPVGASVTVSGTGFTSLSTVGLVFDGVKISSCKSGSLVASTSGSFSCTFSVPSGTSGTTVTATNVGGQTVTGKFTVTSLAIGVSPSLGPVGASVAVSGTGFSVLTTVGLVFDGVTITTCASGTSLKTSATGAFACSIKVPTGTSGTTVTATDAGGSKISGVFVVTVPAIAVVPGQGPVGAGVAIAGAGFSVLSPVTLTFDGVKVSSCTLGSLTTSSLGLFACTLKVPTGTSGTAVIATDVGGSAATAAFVVTPPKVTASPTQGAVGSSVTISGTGFSVLATVGLVFDGVKISSCTSGSLTASASGSFGCTFKVPSGTSGTTVTATDVGGSVATCTFTVTSSKGSTTLAPTAIGAATAPLAVGGLVPFWSGGSARGGQASPVQSNRRARKGIRPGLSPPFVPVGSFSRRP